MLQLSIYPSIYQVDALGWATTETGNTISYGLLHAAAANGHLEMARELLKRGANVDIQGSGGEIVCGLSASVLACSAPARLLRLPRAHTWRHLLTPSPGGRTEAGSLCRAPSHCLPKTRL